MIVYNVKRRWFTEKALADKYRVAEGLRPHATLKVQVNDRNALAALLNALCEPQVSQVLEIADKHDLMVVKSAVLVDRAYIDPNLDIPDCVPDFLLRSHGLSR